MGANGRSQPKVPNAGFYGSDAMLWGRTAPNPSGGVEDLSAPPRRN